MNPGGSRQSRTAVVLLSSAIGAAAISFGFLPTLRAHAQSVQAAQAGTPSFEVASIKRCREREDSYFRVLPNRLVIRNHPVDFYIQFAYGHDFGEFGFKWLGDNELSGGPDWVYGHLSGYEGYDLDAKVDDALVAKLSKLRCGSFFQGPCGYREPMLLMVQSLLAERFKLKVRRETKQLPVYALVIAKGGPKFLHAKFDTADDPAHTADPTLPRPPRPPCPTGLACWHNYGSMGYVAEVLSGYSEIGRPVLDRTGLEGGYYLALQFAIERPLAASAGTDNAPPEPAGPSIFAALQQQLGLKLKPTKGPVESIVIEHIERPTEN